MIHQFLVVSQSYRQVMGRWNKTFRLAKHLRHKSIIEHHEHSCQGLGYIESPKIPSDKSSKEYRTFTSSHYKEIDNTYTISKAVH